MEKKELSKKTLEKIRGFQKNEITEHFIYREIAKKEKKKNRKIIERISEDELKHYKKWKEYTGKEVKPDRLKIWKHLFLLRVLGITFTVKQMEKGEEQAQEEYEKIVRILPETRTIFEEENRHEEEIIRLLEEDKLKYIGSMILGLNDALVELTGALAGLSFALQDTRLVGLAGTITGIAAAMSMMSSEYLAKKSEGKKRPGKAALYTGGAYILAVVLLVAPFFVFTNFLYSIAATLLVVLAVIAVFTYFVSIVKEGPFKKHFLEMAAISLGVAAASFVAGLALRSFLGVG